MLYVSVRMTAKGNYRVIGNQLLQRDWDPGRQVRTEDKNMTKHVPRCYRGNRHGLTYYSDM